MPLARSHGIVLKSILSLIPLHLIEHHSVEPAIAAKAHTFSVLSHLTAMLFEEYSPSMGPNNICEQALLVGLVSSDRD